MSQVPSEQNSQDKDEDEVVDEQNSQDQDEVALLNQHHAYLRSSKLAQYYPVTSNLAYSLELHNASCILKLQTNAYVASIILSRFDCANAKNNKDNTVGKEDIGPTVNSEYDKNGILQWLGIITKYKGKKNGVDQFIFFPSSLNSSTKKDLITFLERHKQLTKFSRYIASLKQPWITMNIEWKSCARYLRTLMRMIQWTVPYWDNCF